MSIAQYCLIIVKLCIVAAFFLALIWWGVIGRKNPVLRRKPSACLQPSGSMSSGIQDMARLIVGLIFLSSFIAGFEILVTVYKDLAPYCIFDKETVKNQNIHVVLLQRHSIFFSNDPNKRIPRSELNGLERLEILVNFASGIAIFFGTGYITAKLIALGNRALAAEILNCLKFGRDTPDKKI